MGILAFMPNHRYALWSSTSWTIFCWHICELSCRLVVWYCSCPDAQLDNEDFLLLWQQTMGPWGAWSSCRPERGSDNFTQIEAINKLECCHSIGQQEGWGHKQQRKQYYGDAKCSACVACIHPKTQYTEDKHNTDWLIWIEDIFHHSR